MRPTLKHGPLRLVLAPEHGGAVAGFWLVREGRETALFRPMPETGASALSSGMFPMLPFANCLRENRFSFGGRDWQVAPNMADARLNFHGSGWQLPWTVVSSGVDTALLALEADDGIWRYRGEQQFALGEDTLTVHLRIINLGETAMPFSFGLHPWFPRHGKADVSFAADTLWPTMSEGTALKPVPVPPDQNYSMPLSPPRSPLNVCYGQWTGSARIDWPERRLALTLRADPVWDHLMVHVPTHDPETFCLEPQSNPPCGFDGLNRETGYPAVSILQPGERLAGSMTFYLSPLATEPAGHED